MDSEYLGDAKPACCRSHDIECGRCTGQAARSLASLCANLSASGIEAAFERLFPDTACSEQLPLFAQGYFEATEPDLCVPFKCAVAVA